MIAAAQQYYVLPDSVPTAAVGAAVAVAAAVWAALYALKGRPAVRRLRWPMAGARLVVGFVCLLAAGQLALRWLLLTTSWRLWPIALGGAAAVEALLGLYALERRTIPRRTGLALAGLRTALVLLVIAMLAQPVLSWDLVEQIQRTVAVLLDGSASMGVTDPQRSGAEMLRLAEMLGVADIRRPVRLERVGRRLEELQAELAAVVEDLAAFGDAEPATRQKQLASRRERLEKTLSAGAKVAGDQLELLAKALEGQVKLDDATRTALRDAKARLAVGVRDPLAGAAEPITSGEYPRLVASLRGAVGALQELTGGLREVSEAYDEKVYASLSDEQRDRIAAATDLTRVDLARSVLAHSTGGSHDGKPAAKGLLDQLADGYDLKLYTFAVDCVETDPDRLGRHTRPAGRQGTDLAAAIDKVARDTSDGQLAGVVVLTDGRHNGAGRLEPLADRLGGRGAAICSVVMAPPKSPRDAAVVSVRAAQTVVETDQFVVDAELKLDGLAGRDVQVALYDADRQVASRTLHVPKDLAAYRTRVRFSDEPEGVGLHHYRVRIDAVEGEAFAENNEYPLAVSLTKQRVQLLVIEDRPRWEFRYLKNLFADRDPTVKLQYLLLQPDRIEGQTKRPKLPASASRAAGQVEATLPPASEQEWMKFDVIVLGDLPRTALSDEQIDILHRFVTRRGGTLVAIAGPNAMPHAWADTPLAEILPVTAELSRKPVAGGQKTGFEIALTDEGLRSTIMFQDVEPEKNLAVWDSLPPIYWRHPGLKAKQGAGVLAYALPASPPEFLRPPDAPTAADDEAMAARQLQRRQFQQANPLVAVHNVAAGRVMALGFDRTWRMRYRVGDTHHHRFWGQVMRWATAGKLRAGTDCVKLGTDQVRYGPAAPVQVRAKIVQLDLTPVRSNSVAVKVFSGEKLVMRKRMTHQEDSAGMYEARLGVLPSGVYRVELDAPEALPILAARKVRQVATEFSVDPVGDAEQTELSADRGLLNRLAGRSGGVVLEPDQAGRLLEFLGPKSLRRQERKEVRLWDGWPLLVLIVLLASVEWIVRKRIGLA